MTDKEIETYYTTHTPKPQFFSYDTLGQKIFYAFDKFKNELSDKWLILYNKLKNKFKE